MNQTGLIIDFHCLILFIDAYMRLSEAMLNLVDTWERWINWEGLLSK